MAEKIGEGHLAAMGRLGLQELRNAFNPSRESIAGSEMGLFGTQTQGEIADAREGSGKETLDDLKAYAQEKAQEMEKGRDGPERNGPEQDRGMER